MIVFHNAYDARKPGDPDHHRFPVLIAEICGTHVDLADGRVAVRVSRAASVEGPRQVGSGRSPDGYTDEWMLNRLRIGIWQQIRQNTLVDVVANRASWDARQQARSAS